MQVRNWIGVTLCLLLVFGLILSGCVNNRAPSEDPGGQTPVDNEPPGEEDPGEEDPGEEDPGEEDPPPLTEGTLEDLEPLPYSVIYQDLESNVVMLDLRDKSSTVIAAHVHDWAADLANNQIALAIADPEGEFFDQMTEIALYSTTDGNIEVLGTSTMAYDLHFSPNGYFLAVGHGIGGMDIYDLEKGEVFNAEDENLEVSVNYRPVWSPSGTVYAMPMIYIWEKAGPPGIYIVDPVNQRRTAVLEVNERMARPHSWLDQGHLLIEIESEPYTWVDESGWIVGLGEEYVSGDFKILDIETGSMTDAEAPDYSWQEPEYESSDGRWILRLIFDEHGSSGIKLQNTETGADYAIAEGHSCLLLEDELPTP